MTSEYCNNINFKHKINQLYKLIFVREENQTYLKKSNLLQRFYLKKVL